MVSRIAGVVVQLAAENIRGLDGDGRRVEPKPARVPPVVDALCVTKGEGRWMGGRTGGGGAWGCDGQGR